MTDNEIIKALELCPKKNLNGECPQCPYYESDGTCFDFLMADSLDLINRQKAEIGKLQAFKSYFDNLYGEGLDIANWHKNGDLEPFDSFYDSALEEMVGEG